MRDNNVLKVQNLAYFLEVNISTGLLLDFCPCFRGNKQIVSLLKYFDHDCSNKIMVSNEYFASGVCLTDRGDFYKTLW